MQDIVVTGGKYRVLKDKAKKIWKVISWWTSAEDVEFADGSKLQDVYGGIRGVSDTNVNSNVHIPTSHVVADLAKNFSEKIKLIDESLKNNIDAASNKLSVKHIFKKTMDANGNIVDTKEIDYDELEKPLHFAPSTMNKVGTKAYFGDGQGLGQEGLFCVKGVNDTDKDAKTGIGLISAQAKGSAASADWKEVGTILYDGEKFVFSSKIESPTIEAIDKSIEDINKTLKEVQGKYGNVDNAIDEIKNETSTIKTLDDFKKVAESKIGVGTENTGSFGQTMKSLQDSINSLNKTITDFRNTYDRYVDVSHASTHNSIDASLRDLSSQLNGKANSTDVPSLLGYAKEEWVKEQLKNYQKKKTS